MSFKKNKYIVIKQAISKDLATFIANYFCMQKQVLDTCRKERYISPYETLLGYYEGQDEQIPDPNNPGQMIDKYPDGRTDPDLLKEAYRRYAEFFSTVPEVEEAKASGGRVGRAMGTPMTGERPADQETREEPKIDFATLRARLPKEIGDDIVKLIALSPEALEDFATIATQQDVDLFNQKYSVNLVLPQE